MFNPKETFEEKCKINELAALKVAKETFDFLYGETMAERDERLKLRKEEEERYGIDAVGMNLLEREIWEGQQH